MEQPSKKSPGDLRRMTEGMRVEFLKLPSTRSHYGLVAWKPFAAQIMNMPKDAAIQIDMKVVKIIKAQKGWGYEAK